MKSFFLIFIPLFTIMSINHSIFSQESKPITPYKVLLVTAHPDDDALFAGTVYRLTHEFGGKVDLALITNGEGGFKYSTLGEPIYGLELTKEEVGREYLPGIRKKELIAGGNIVGIRSYFFFDQTDDEYYLDPGKTLNEVWDWQYIIQRLANIIQKGEYDFIFTMLPRKDTHAHHKAATILTLRAVNNIAANKRPIVLGTWITRKNQEKPNTFSELEGYPLTKTSQEQPVGEFNRLMKFGHKNRLDYTIVVNWLIAEHKSQGTMQLLMGLGEKEQYWFYQINDPKSLEKTKKFFKLLATPHKNQSPNSE